MGILDRVVRSSRVKTRLVIYHGEIVSVEGETLSELTWIALIVHESEGLGWRLVQSLDLILEPS